MRGLRLTRMGVAYGARKSSMMNEWGARYWCNEGAGVGWPAPKCRKRNTPVDRPRLFSSGLLLSRCFMLVSSMVWSREQFTGFPQGPIPLVRGV